MKFDKCLIQFLAVFLLGVMMVSIFFFVFSLFGDIKGEQVDCYDGYNNKILDQKCVTDSGFNSIEAKYKAIVISFSLVIVSFLIILLLVKFDGREE